MVRKRSTIDTESSEKSYMSLVDMNRHLTKDPVLLTKLLLYRAGFRMM